MFGPERRDAVLARLLDRARSDPRVVGAALTGSTAAGTEDRWSDLDLFLGLSDDAELEDVLADWSALLHDELGAVHHFDLSGRGATYRAFLLADGLEVDVGFAPAGVFRRMSGEAFEVVFGHAGPDLVDGPADTDHLVGLAWHHVLHARAAIDRGRPWSAEYWISALRDQVLTLASVRHGLPTAHGRGFDRLPATVTDSVRTGLPIDLEPHSLTRALVAATRALLAEIDEVDHPTAARLRPVLLDSARGSSSVRNDGSRG